MKPECRPFAGKLSAYAEGTLSGPERDELTGHLRECSTCAQEVALLRRKPAAGPQTLPRRAGGPKPAAPPAWVLKAPLVALAAVAALLLTVKFTRLAPPPEVPRSVAPAAPQPLARPAPALPVPAVSAAASHPAPPLPMLAERRLRIVLRVRDLTASSNGFRALFERVPVRLLRPPFPLHYELLIAPEQLEDFLQGLKAIGSPTDLREEGSSSSGPSGLPVQVAVDVFSAGPV